MTSPAPAEPPAELGTYRPGAHLRTLDGVRGLAILLVVIFHAACFCPRATNGATERLYYTAVSVGWVGVDLFFALSGFLITGILVDTRDGPRYFRNFYARRALRIFPLFYAVLLVTFGVLPLLGGDVHGLTWLQERQWLFWLYLQNWSFALEAFPTPNLMGHFWSLAIEEQFYLIWPLVVLRARGPALTRLCVAALAASLAIRLVILTLPELATQSHALVRYSTLTRVDALLVGALLACWIRDPGASQRLLLRRPLTILAAACAAFGLLCVHALAYRTHFWLDLLGFLILALLFGSLVSFAVTGPSSHPVIRLFSSRALSFVGQISYAIYVFHQPLMIGLADVWVSQRSLAFEVPLVRQLTFLVAAGLMSVLAGWLSWRLFERHFLGLKRHFAEPPPQPPAWRRPR